MLNKKWLSLPVAGLLLAGVLAGCSPETDPNLAPEGSDTPGVGTETPAPEEGTNAPEGGASTPEAPTNDSPTTPAP